MSRKYASPPIMEAVCEFRLTPDTNWDLTIPGLLYEKLKDDFPKKEQRFIQEAGIAGTPQEVHQTIKAPQERILFLTEDGKRFIQVGPQLLATHCLAPYPSWDRFKPHIRKAFESLIKTVEVKGLQRIGLRYVNKIEIPHKPVKLEDYFGLYPFLCENLPQEIDSFIVGCLFPFDNRRDFCKVQLTTAAPDNPDCIGFILDLDYFLDKPNAVPVTQSLEWMEEAHQHIEEIFEGCINDRLRVIFKEEK